MKLSEYKNITTLKNLNINTINDLLSDMRILILDKISKNGGFLNESLSSIELIAAINFELENDVLFYNNDNSLYTQLILNGQISLIEKFNNDDIENKNIKILDGTLKENLYFIKYFLKNNSDKKAYFYIYDYQFNQDEIDLIASLSLKKYNLTIIHLDYNINNTLYIEKGINNFRKAKFYQKFKKGIISNHNKSYINQKLYQGFIFLKDKIKNNLIQYKDFKHIKLNYLLIENGNSFNDILLGIKILKNNNGLNFLNIKSSKGYGYCLAKKNPAKFDYIQAFDVKNGELKNNLSFLKEEKFITYIKNIYQNINVLISNKSYFSKYSKNIDFIKFKDFEAIIAIVKNNIKDNYFLILNSLEFLEIIKLLNISAYQNLRLSFLIYDIKDINFLNFNNHYDYDIIAAKDFREMSLVSYFSIKNNKNIVLLYNNIFNSNININYKNMFEWYIMKDVANPNKIIISSFDYCDYIYKLLISKYQNIMLINAINLSKVDDEIFNLLKNKEIIIIADKTISDKIYNLLLIISNKKQINLHIKIFNCEKKLIPDIVKENI